MNNPGRYLTLLPPINGATAITGTPYFTEVAGDRSQMHDGTITFDYMPSQFITITLGVRLSLLRCSLLDRPSRYHASRRKQRFAGAVCVRNRRALRHQTNTTLAIKVRF
jgi:hypothetical protein